MDFTEIFLGAVCLIYLAQDRDWWRALVNTAVNHRVHNPRGIYWLAFSLATY
jgi:hypothetical protein